MCGICGIYSDGALAPDVLRLAAGRMCERIRHRGPDDAGVWSDGARVALGNARLAIIDLSPLGHQPMADEQQAIWLTYNGEIYNFRELREELRGRGFTFRTRTDTEVIIQAYRAYGPKFLTHLRGMFALALWDGPNRRLLLARDRLGIKPLYYSQQPAGLVFASEIKALLASGLVDARPEPAALAAFLRMGSVPGPMTAITGVRELPPATLLRLEAGRLSSERYWEIPAPSATSMRSAEAAALVRERLADAVESHLVSDVPLGVFLSGGLDSSSVVALMRAAGHEHIRTFAITFREGVSEGSFASSVARKFATDHTEQVVGPDDLRQEFDRIVAAMDQPTVDGVNTYFVSKITRATGTIVALSGLGGDEIFAGYPSFRLVPQLQRLRRKAGAVPGVREAAAWMLGLSKDGRAEKLREVLRGRPDIRGAYLGVRGLFPAAGLRGLVASDALAEACRTLDAAALLPEPDGTSGDPIATVGFLEMRSYMHNQLLRDTDVMSMAHSLEVRVPLLDHILVELVARLPGGLRAGESSKGLLTAAVGTLLPPEVVGRAKWGFTFPLEHWLRGRLRAMAEQRLSEAASGGLFRAAAVRRLWHDFLAARTHWSRVWAVIVADAWVRQLRSQEITATGSLRG